MRNLPIGSTVWIQLVDRTSFTVLLMVVEPTGIIVKPKGFPPRPARTVAFDQIALIQPVIRTEPVKAVLIGAATGAAVFGTLVLWLFSRFD